VEEIAGPERDVLRGDRDACVPDDEGAADQAGDADRLERGFALGSADAPPHRITA